MTVSASERRYTVAELAAQWNIDKSTIYRMIHSGRLRAERHHGVRGKTIRVTAAAVADYLSGAVA